MRLTIHLVPALALVFYSLAFTQDDSTSDKPRNNQALDAAEMIERSQQAFNYAADDMKFRLTMELITQDGGRRIRVMTMLRRDESDGGNQKYFIYFHEPGDVRRMVFMVWKYPEKEDDRWLFIPAVDLVRRIAADDKRSSFVGSDFTYEDVSGRDVNADTHSILREEKLGDRECHVILSVPKATTDYVKRISWINKENFLPLKEEYYDTQGELFRVYTSDKIENITAGESDQRQVFPTVTRRSMKNVKTGHQTIVTFNSVAYNLGLKEEDFSERYMRRPPSSLIR